MVTAAANTGSVNNNNIDVIKVDHTNRFIYIPPKPNIRELYIVVIKFIDPKRELIPNKCIVKIIKSTDGPELPIVDNGG